MADQANFVDLSNEEETTSAGISESIDETINSSIEQFACLDNASLFDDISWTPGPLRPDKELAANPRFQYLQRRSISEPPAQLTELVADQQVVFHRELHAKRRPKGRQYRTKPYAYGQRRSRHLVSLGESTDEPCNLPASTATNSQWQLYLHDTQSLQTRAAIPMDSHNYRLDPQLDSALPQGNTLSISGKRTTAPVLKITLQELRDIITCAVRTTLAESHATRR